MILMLAAKLFGKLIQLKLLIIFFCFLYFLCLIFFFFLTEGSSEASGSIQDDDSDVIPLQSRIREGPQLTRRSIRIMSNVAKAEQEQRLIALTRTIDRAASLPTERNAQAYDSIRESKERGFSMIRDSVSCFYFHSNLIFSSFTSKWK